MGDNLPEDNIIIKLIQEGDELLQNGDLDAAEQKYHGALALNPASAEALYSIGAVYTHRQDFQTALEWGERAVAADPGFKPAHALVGNVLFGINKYKEALEALAIADESNLMIRAQRGLCFEKLERWNEAEEHFRSVLENDRGYLTRYSVMASYDQNPFSADVHHALARVLQQQGKIEEAKLHYHLTKRIDPTTQLDPMYLEIMSESDLENHPIFDKKEFEKPSAESKPEEKLRYLLQISDYATLHGDIQEYKSKDFISYVAGMINVTQREGEFTTSAQMRVIGDVLNGQEQADLFASLQLPAWERLFELTEMVHAGKIPIKESLELADRLEFDWKSVNLLLSLSNRFVELEPETGFILAHLVEQVLIRSPTTSDAGSGALLLGKAYYRARKLEKAAESFQKASDIFSQANDRDGELVALYRLDDIQIKQGRFTEALSTIDQYIQLAESRGKTRNVISGRYRRAWTLFMADRDAESYEEGLMVASMIQEEDVGDELRENLEKLLVQAAEKAGKSVPDEVLETIRSETVGRSESVDTLLSRAIIAQESGEMDEALSSLEQARTIAESEAPLKRREDVVRVLTDMGVLLSEMERLTEAMDKLREALWFAEPISAEVDIWTILVNLGLLADLQGQKDEAITYLERALQEARQQRSHDREGQSLLQLMQTLNDVDPAKAYEYLHEIEKDFRDFLPFLKPQEKDLPHDWVEGVAAMEAGQYREGIAALEHLCRDKSPDAECLHPEALANRGNAHSHLGEIPEAINCWENAANAWLGRGDQGLAIDVLGRVADMLRQEGRGYSETLARMFEIWDDKIENIETQCRVGVELAEKAVDLDEFTRSEIVLEKVLSIVTSDEWRNITDEMQARITLGIIYRKTSRYRQAAEQYQKALACAQYLKDGPAEGTIRGWMAIAYRYLDELDSAVEQYRRAIDIAERYQDAEAAAVHRMNLAASLFLLDHDVEGVNTALEALATFDAAGQKEMALNVLLMLLEYGDWEGLSAELQARIEAFMDESKQSHDPLVLGYVYTKHAQWIASTGDIEGTQDMMEKVIAMYGEIGDCFNQASAFLNLARILEEPDTAQAISNVTMARDLAISIGQIHLTVKCQEFLLTAALRVGDDQQINSYLNSVLDGWIRLRRRFKSDRDRTNFVDRVSNITGRCAAHFLQDGQIARVFELQEWGRAQALTDLLTESLTSIQSDKKEVRDLVAQESEILNSMRDHEPVYLDTPPLMEPRIEESMELTRDLEGELAAVYKALENYDPCYVLQKKGVPVNMARAQALLSTLNRPAVIVTLGFVGDEIVAMTLLPDQKTPSAYRTGMNRMQVDKLLETFDEEIHFYQGEGVDTWRNQAAPLLHGVAEDIYQDDLVVLVPEGNLQQLPLHALKLPNGQLFAERAAIVYAPSLAVLEMLQQTEHEKRMPRLLSVGVAFPDEARAVSLHFWGMGRCLSGNFLNKDEIRKQLSESSILHFSCHGYFDPQHYLESGLVLCNTDTPLREEILSLRDLMTWHLDSDLVVLSACETGRGTVAPSEFLGLSRGFLAAGAQSVIVALWKIDNAATQAFMLTFYENLQRQLRKSDMVDIAEALRRTQCQYAKSSRLYDWAGFKLIGQPTITWKGSEK